MKYWDLKVAIGIVFSLGATAKVYAQETESLSRGSFSVGISAGDNNLRFLNTDGKFTAYQYTSIGYYLDMQIFNFGSGGALRAAGNYQNGEGKSEALSTDTIDYSEYDFGPKLYANSWLYFYAGLGKASADLIGKSDGASLDLKYDIRKMSAGIEFPIFDELYVGIDVSYRNGYIPVNGNPDLTQNTYGEGVSYSLRILWCPPFKTINLVQK